MAFDVDGQLQQFFLAQGLAGQGIGSHQARHDGGGAAAHAPRWRYGQLHPGFQGDRLHAHFTPHPLGSAVNQVVGAAAQVGALFAFDDQLEAFGAALQHLELELVVEIECCPKASKPGPRLAVVAGTSTTTVVPISGFPIGVRWAAQPVIEGILPACAHGKRR